MLVAPLTLDSSRQILCFYANRTAQTQVICSSNILNGYFERVIFPGRSLLFHALPEALLEIYTLTPTHTIRTEGILCEELKVSDEIIASLLSRLS